MLRGSIPRDADWDVMVDLFMHRDITVKKAVEDDEEEEAAVEEVAGDVTETIQNFKKADEGEEEEEGAEEEQNWGK